MGGSSAKPLHLRLLLEGEEVPVIAASVSANTDAPAVASIQIIPLDEAMELKPRTMVHLFSLDMDKRGYSGVLEKDYKTAFTGEIVGYSTVQTAMSRSIVLQCLDHSSYWDAAHATGLNFGVNGNVFSHTGTLWGADASQFDNIINDTSHVLVNWLSQKPKTPGLQQVGGLAGGIIHLLEMMGGIPGHRKGINDFFTVAELRNRILSQITADEHDNTAYRLLSSQVFYGWLINGIQEVGEHITIRDLMKLLFRYIYYEAVPNPSPKFDEASSGVTKTQGRFVSLSSLPNVEVARDRVQSVLNDLSIETGDTGQSPAHVVTKIDVYLSRLSEAQKRISSVKGNSSAEMDRAFIGDQLSRAVRILESAASKLRSGPLEGNAPAMSMSPASQPLRAALDRMEGSSTKVYSGSSTMSFSSTQRLRTQIIRPDVWFAAPPTCNVIFPEQYTQMTHDRSFIQETTRMLIFAHEALISNGGTNEDRLLASQILAPYLDLKSKKLVGSRSTSGLGYRTLMPHELHTGIIPRIEWVPNHVSVQSPAFNSDRTHNTAQDSAQARLSWSRKIALHHFFKYRFATRQATVSGRYNPNVVAGFPALIITKPFILSNDLQKSLASQTSDQARMDYVLGAADELNAPTQFVGMVAGVSHSLSQEGGTTQVSLHHVRKHRGADDEFLDLVLKSGSTSKPVTVRTVLHLPQLEDLGNEKLISFLADCTPQTEAAPKKRVSHSSTKNISLRRSVVQMNTDTGELEEVENEFVRECDFEDEVVDTGPPKFTVWGSIEKLGKQVVPMPSSSKVTRGSKGPMNGTVMGVEVLDNQRSERGGKKVFHKVAIYEQVDVPTRKAVPIEHVIKPTWVSNAYLNTSIGEKIYQPFFGCGSIVDQISADFGSFDLSTDSDAIVDVGPEDDPSEVLSRLIAQEEAKDSVSIEKAVNYIGYVYGIVKSRGMDVESFISNLTSRPIADKEQVLGSRDLSFKVSGTAVTAEKLPDGSDPVIGFHSQAVHPALVEAGGLTGLLKDPHLQLPRVTLDSKDRSSVPPEYDVRMEKRERVLKYVNRLVSGSRAFRG